MNDSIKGIWSGKHLTFEITENGAKLDFDCAKGQVSDEIIIESNNSFEVSGIYLPERGGFSRMNDDIKSCKVVISGEIKGKKMNITVKNLETTRLIGKFTVYQGREPYLIKCR